MIRLGLIGGTLSVVNNMAAILALGVFQGPLVAFTTPFAFCLGRVFYPRLPAATVIYFPVVIVSMFTLNFGGPPGPYKIGFMAGAILYDIVCYVTRVRPNPKGNIPLWKLILAAFFFPPGLLVGAWLAILWVNIKLPIISRTWVGVAAAMLLFWIIGAFATWVCHKVCHSVLRDELSA
jgi:hypothetical protein